MIHIISRGSKHFLECLECGCKFTFESEDIGGNQHDGINIKCPQCEKIIHLAYKDGRYIPYDETRFDLHSLWYGNQNDYS